MDRSLWAGSKIDHRRLTKGGVGKKQAVHIKSKRVPELFQEGGKGKGRSPTSTAGSSVRKLNMGRGAKAVKGKKKGKRSTRKESETMSHHRSSTRVQETVRRREDRESTLLPISLGDDGKKRKKMQ